MSDSSTFDDEGLVPEQPQILAASIASSPFSDFSDEEFQSKSSGHTSVSRKVLQDTQANTKCSFCEKTFKNPKCLKQHTLLSCPKNPSVKRDLSCEQCNTVFSRKDALNRHISKGRCSQSAEKGSRHVCLFANCDAKFWHKTTLIDHLKASHEANNLPCKHLEFPDWKSFLIWKESEEKEQLSYFSEQFGKKDGRLYYYCQQDGPIRIHQKQKGTSENYQEEDLDEEICATKRKKKSCNMKGRIKSGLTCIAMMKVLKSEKCVSVKYYPMHNHELHKGDLKHQPLTNATNSYINGRLIQGVSPRKILKTLRGNRFSRANRSSEEQKTRNDFINLKTLRERKRLLNMERCLAKDDATAVRMEVEKLKSEETYDVVLIYKPYGAELVYGPESAKALPLLSFMLGIQTKEQAEMMKMAGETILIVDATHDMDQYGCQLVNVVGVDELRRGYPLAHCITSEVNENTLQHFFWSYQRTNS